MTIRAAAYYRISIDKDGEMLAVSRQQEECRRIAQVRGWTISPELEFTDNSVSASDRGRSRPGYNALEEAYRAGAFDALLCWDLDRLTRRPRQLEDWIDAAEQRGLPIVTANGEADLGTVNGRLFARMKLAVARSEMELKSARQKAAARQRAKLGKTPGGRRLTGYTPDGQVLEVEASMVRELYGRFVAGESLHALAAMLTKQQLPTRRGGTAWHPATVRTMLLNPRYAGRQVYLGQPNGVQGQWEAIVNADIYDLAQAMLSDPRRKAGTAGTDRRHLGSGLWLCTCGTTMRSHAGTSYRCRAGCYSRTRQPVDEHVERIIRARLARHDLTDLLPDPEDELAVELVARVAAAHARLATIEEDYDADRIDGRRYAAAAGRAREALTAAQARLAALSPSKGSPILRAPDPVAAYDSASLMLRRAAIDALCTVTLLQQPRGGAQRHFDPASVSISWRR